MRFQLSPELIDKIKKQDVRIRNNFKKALEIFFKDPYNLELDNHELKREWEGFRSIDVTADLRAIYKEDKQSLRLRLKQSLRLRLKQSLPSDEGGEEDETAAYFVAFGTHIELYKNK